MTGSWRVIAPDRYLRLSPLDHAVRLVRQGRVVFGAPNALQLFEGDREPVWYLPLASVPQGLLHENGQHFHCRWKGEAVYFDVRIGDDRLEHAAWSYRDVPDEVAALRGHVAFDATRFSVEANV